MCQIGVGMAMNSVRRTAISRDKAAGSGVRMYQ
jgi:hypothetical protein